MDGDPVPHSQFGLLRQRRFALWMFGAGFAQRIILIVIGTFIRGPGWIWFWPGQTWDHNAVVFDKNVDLHDMIAQSSIGKTLHLGFLAQNPGKFLVSNPQPAVARGEQAPDARRFPRAGRARQDPRRPGSHRHRRRRPGGPRDRSRHRRRC